MFENITKFFKKISKREENKSANSKDAAKERLHLVLMQDRANVSVDFLELMKQEIIDVIKKYIDVDESAIDVRLTNKENEDGTNGAPALYANIPIVNIKNESVKKEKLDSKKEEIKKEKEKVVEKLETDETKQSIDNKNKNMNSEESIEEEIAEQKEVNNRTEKLEEIEDKKKKVELNETKEKIKTKKEKE